MKKFLIQVVLLLIVIFAGTWYAFQGGNFSITPNNTPATSQTQLQVGSTLINIELADTDSKRKQGLGGRDSLASDSGMLFIFDKSDKYSFWMKGMKFPLDFIWIRDDTVVDLLTNIQPPQPNQPDENLPRYQPITYVNKVLEVNAGFVSSHNIKLGDKVQLTQSQSSSQ